MFTLSACDKSPSEHLQSLNEDKYPVANMPLGHSVVVNPKLTNFTVGKRQLDTRTWGLDSIGSVWLISVRLFYAGGVNKNDKSLSRLEKTSHDHKIFPQTHITCLVPTTVMVLQLLI